jgi:hypothetical protein
MKMNDEKQMITIDGKEYDFEELENNEQYLVNQIRDLNTKIAQGSLVWITYVQHKMLSLRCW